MSQAQQMTKIALLALVSVHLVAQVAPVSGFNLFNRARLFQRQPQEVPQQEQLAFAANSLVPIYGQFGPARGDILRMRAAQSHQAHELAAPLPGYYGPPLSALETSHLTNPTLVAVQPPAPSSQSYANFQQEQDGLDEQALAAQSPPMRMEPSQSELVDKLERHIGKQIERTLDSHDRVHQLADQLGQRVAAASGFRAEEKRAEKEAAASGEGHHEEEEHQEPEKRHHHEEEEHHKEPEESHHHHHEEHHHEHPPEAFEVHHKKGGKSFQYFHQGHHH